MEAFRDLGGFPPDADLDRIAAELNVEELQDMAPAEMSPEEVAARMRELVTSLVSYGARLPKDLFLFIKGMVYLNGAIATLAADVDIIAEMAAVSEHFVTAHGDRLVDEFGVDLAMVEFDADVMKQQIKAQTGADVDTISYREMQELQAQQRARLRGR
jgi:ubiquinone biosynthesis protein